MHIHCLSIGLVAWVHDKGTQDLKVRHHRALHLSQSSFPATSRSLHHCTKPSNHSLHWHTSTSKYFWYDDIQQNLIFTKNTKNYHRDDFHVMITILMFRWTKLLPRLISGCLMYSQSRLVCSWMDTKGLKHERTHEWETWQNTSGCWRMLLMRPRPLS